MAGFGLEQSVCTGRGFDANGFLGKFKAWVVKSLANHGPAWFIVDDQSALGTDPYIVVSDQNAAGANVPAKYMQVLLPSATASQIRVFYFIYWNSTTHKGLGIYGAHNVRTDDAIDFIYDFRGGPQCLFMQTFTTSATWEASWIDEWTADPNLLDSVDATTAVANWVEASAQVRAIDLAGTVANALDGNGNCYLNIVFVSGSNYRLDLYSNSGRTTLVAQSSNFTALAASTNTTSVGLSASGGSGVTATVYLRGTTAADATIVFRYNQITVGSGEGAQFVVGNYYFIYDMTVRPCVNSFKVVSKASDVLTIDRLYLPFPVGAKIGSYPHKFFVGGTGTALMATNSSIPYFNVLGSASAYTSNSSPAEIQEALTIPVSQWFGSPQFAPNAYLSQDDNYITTMSPDRKSSWAVQRPGVAEFKSFGQTNFSARNGISAYGQLKNVIVGAVGTMTANIHGRRLGGIDYTYFRTINNYSQNSGNFAALFRETESVS